MKSRGMATCRLSNVSTRARQEACRYVRGARTWTRNILFLNIREQKAVHISPLVLLEPERWRAFVKCFECFAVDAFDGLWV
jgi:hypothetical protein